MLCMTTPANPNADPARMAPTMRGRRRDQTTVLFQESSGKNRYDNMSP